MLDLPPGGRHTYDTGDSEWIVLPLSGSCTVTADGRTFPLTGRPDVFRAVTDFAYAPRDARVSHHPRRRPLRLAGARCDRRLPARHGPASGVPVELRAAPHLLPPGQQLRRGGRLPCDRLIAVEVLTPGGNWSSYPPHKHDEHRPERSPPWRRLHYFEIAARGGTPGFGYQRVSPSAAAAAPTSSPKCGTATPSSSRRLARPVHRRARPPHVLLNVMAGPGTERAWLIRDHP